MNYHAGINQTDVRNQAGAKKNKKKKKNCILHERAEALEK